MQIKTIAISKYKGNVGTSRELRGPNNYRTVTEPGCAKNLVENARRVLENAHREGEKVKSDRVRVTLLFDGGDVQGPPTNFRALHSK